MNTNHHQPQVVDTAELPPYLLTHVMARIAAEQRQMILRRRLIPLATFFVTVLTLAIPVWNSFQADMVSSGFGKYLALGLYDFKIVLMNWQDFSLSLLESLPIISTAELLIVMFGFCLTLKFLFTYGNEVVHHHRLSANF